MNIQKAFNPEPGKCQVASKSKLFFIFHLLEETIYDMVLEKKLETNNLWELLF